jgi:hypothetical protein
LFADETQEALLLKSIFGEYMPRTQAIFLQGLSLHAFLPGATSTILTRRHNGGTGLVLMSVEPVASETGAKKRAKEMAASIDTLTPDTFGPVIQRVVENESLADFRTGVVVPAKPSAEEVRALLLSALPLPPELVPALTL